MHLHLTLRDRKAALVKIWGRGVVQGNKDSFRQDEEEEGADATGAGSGEARGRRRKGQVLRGPTGEWGLGGSEPESRGQSCA